MGLDDRRPPYEAELAAALALAREAGLRAARAQEQEGPLDVTRKADHSIVTSIDRELDDLLVGRLRARFPDDAAVGEESADGAVPGDAPRLWLVDPIDGTSNYAVGAGEFTVVIGLAEAGRPVVGVVYEPIGRQAFYAAAGGPAMTQRGSGQPEAIRVSDRAALRGARLVRSLSRRPSVTERHLAGLGVPQPARVGSLALRICRIAAGDYDFTYSTDFRGGAWDLCGPIAVLEAAGGLATDLDGRPIRFGDGPARPPAGLVVSNGRLHEAVRAGLASRPR